MKPIPAVVDRDRDHDIAAHARAIQAALVAVREARDHESKAAERLETAQQVHARARLALGQALMAARPCWPTTGPRARGWGEFLAEQRIDQDVALDAMKYAGYVVERFPGTSGNVPGDLKLPTMREAGLDTRGRIEDAPHAADSGPGVPQDDANDAAGTDDEADVDRGAWCTPRVFTDAIGPVDYDPCANEYSHVQARTTFRLDHGQDGILLASTVPAGRRVFINPDYELGSVIRWMDAYAHARFIFLLRLDTSTEWFERLYESAELILVPRRTRIQFEPPPGVVASSNPYPHGFFYRHASDATDEMRRLCFAWRVEHSVAA